MSGDPLRRSILAASVVLSLINGAYAGPTLDENARIVLACLLGGVPALSLIMAFGFCLYVRKRKRELREHALANGIELDEEGWPVQHTQRVTVAPTASRPEPPRDTRSYSSSAGDFKAPSLYVGNPPYSPRYNHTSTQMPAGAAGYAVPPDDNYRHATSPPAY